MPVSGYTFKYIIRVIYDFSHNNNNIYDTTFVVSVYRSAMMMMMILLSYYFAYIIQPVDGGRHCF